MNSSQSPSPPHPSAQLGLWDAVSIIVGIVVGTGIYETPPLILKNVSGPWMALGVWALAGLLSFVGALCYAELATTYRRSGGDYVYLSQAYGSWAGFLFGWAQLTVVLTASIGMMAYVFADYAVKYWGPEAAAFKFWLAAGPVVVLALFNVLGVVFGKGTQNVLTLVKVLGLGGVLGAGLFWPSPRPTLDQQLATSAAGLAASPLGDAPLTTVARLAGGLAPLPISLASAMVLILLTYGGWNDAAYVAAEVRDGRRNVPRALFLGIVAITATYLLVNAAYLWGLGYSGVRQSDAVAADVLGLALGNSGTKAMCLLVMVSALGAMNGLIFAGSRVYSTLGTDHPIFGWLGWWRTSTGSPAGAILGQAAIAVGLIAVVGTGAGQETINALLAQAGMQPETWEGRGGFESLLKCSAPIFWVFFLLTGLSLFILRFKNPQKERPFSVPLFPLVPLVFCLTCSYMIYSGVLYAGKLGLVGAGLLLIGLPLYGVSRLLAMVQQPSPTAGSTPEPAPESA